MTDLIKKEDSSFQLTKGKLVSKTSGFKARVEASKAEAIDPNTMPNRLCLMLDVSGSMSTEEHSNDSGTSKQRIELLKDAVQNFVSRCNFVNTAIAMKTFPSHDEAPKLTANGSYVVAMSMSLTAGGGTPLRQCIEFSLNEVPMTRGIVVSDGGATDWSGTFDGLDDENESSPDKLLTKYKELGIPIDCVHISLGEDGEDLLKKIARETGGIFIKFTDVSAFSKAFGYLTPSYRAMLTSGSVNAAQLGAREVQK
jgi:Mg-chelatase subunit ChlD